MRQFLIHLLGGHTDNDILRTRNILIDMAGFAQKNAADNEDFHNAMMTHFYDGKSQAYMTASRCLDDMVRPTNGKDER